MATDLHPTPRDQVAQTPHPTRRGRRDSGPRPLATIDEDVLLPIVYEELRRVAHGQLCRQQVGHTLNTTALVHEAYLKLANHAGAPFADRAHFFGVACRAMRQVLIDYARRHSAVVHGGDLQRVPFDEAEIAVDERAAMLLGLDEALTRLAAVDERLSRVVECRFFGGLTERETAAALGVTERTVRRDWTKARMWLLGEMGPGAR